VVVFVAAYLVLSVLQGAVFSRIPPPIQHHSCCAFASLHSVDHAVVHVSDAQLVLLVYSRTLQHKIEGCPCAGSASVVYITFGGIKWDYGALMILTGFFITVLGQKMTYHIIDTLGRRSVVVIAMALLLTVGAGIMAYEIFPALIEAHVNGFFHVSRICR
jgi:hypothetical protein